MLQVCYIRGGTPAGAWIFEGKGRGSGCTQRGYLPGVTGLCWDEGASMCWRGGEVLKDFNLPYPSIISLTRFTHLKCRAEFLKITAWINK